MQRYAPSTDEGSCEFCGFMSEASDGEFVKYSDAQAEIARLSAEHEAEDHRRCRQIGDAVARAEKAEAALAAYGEPVVWRESDGDGFLWHDSNSAIGKSIAKFPHFYANHDLLALYARPAAHKKLLEEK